MSTMDKMKEANLGITTIQLPVRTIAPKDWELMMKILSEGIVPQLQEIPELMETYLKELRDDQRTHRAQLERQTFQNIQATEKTMESRMCDINDKCRDMLEDNRELKKKLANMKPITWALVLAQMACLILLIISLWS